MRVHHPSFLQLACFGLLAASLTGCEAMSKKECLSADWYQVGYQDGRDGDPRSRIEDIAESCAKAGVTPDRERYFAGRDEGLREYCTPAHGYDLGVNGSSYGRVCPPGAAAAFEAAYGEGRRLYDARRHVRELDEKRHRLEDDLAKAASDKDKRQIRNELEDLDHELRHARDWLQSVENDTQRPY